MKITTDQLKPMLLQFGSLPDELYQAIADRLTFKVYKKGEKLCKEGAIANHLCFIRKGVVRQYYIREGIEFTSAFSLVGHNEVFTSYESFSKRKPSSLIVEAIENVELFSLHYNDLQTILKQEPRLMRLEKLILDRYFYFLKERFYAFQHLNATQRYIQILEQYPELIQQIEQQYIASYIGIAAPSLARLKRNLLKSRK